MQTFSGNNKRIIKNTLFLYVRMLIILAVNLFTVRIIFRVLGVEDYGIYNVVAGFVVSFTFLANTTSTAIQRFLSYTLGLQKYDDYQGAKAYFSQTDQSDSSKLMDNHEYFERFSELSKTDAFQNALVNKGATLGFTPIDIKKYVESSRLQQLRDAVEKNNEKEKQEDNEIEK